MTRISRCCLAGACAAVLAALLAPTAAYAADVPVPVPSSDNLPDRGTGAVTMADRDFIVKVRLAGLWEIPAGNMAVNKSKNPRVREIGRNIAAQHVTLDKLDIAVARKLGLAIPSEPTAEQQGWLSEMQAANATTFDQIFIDRLRAAHGKIFPAIGTIRSSTRNDSVRKLAQEANQFVMTHMTLLESSGLVDYGALPTAPPPAADRGPVPMDPNRMMAAQSSDVPGLNTTLVLLVLAIAVIAGLVTTVRIIRNR